MENLEPFVGAEALHQSLDRPVGLRAHCYQGLNQPNVHEQIVLVDLAMELW